MLNSKITQDFSKSSPTECSDLLAKKCIYQIDDPLWKYVCTELMSMMGADVVMKLWDCKLNFSFPSSQGISISCYDQEAASLVQKFDFVIINVLKKYFSTLNTVSVEME